MPTNGSWQTIARIKIEHSNDIISTGEFTA